MTWGLGNDMGTSNNDMGTSNNDVGTRQGLGIN